jgi:hypothetical protein
MCLCLATLHSLRYRISKSFCCIAQGFTGQCNSMLVVPQMRLWSRAMCQVSLQAISSSLVMGHASETASHNVHSVERSVQTPHLANSLSCTGFMT